MEGAHILSVGDLSSVAPAISETLCSGKNESYHCLSLQKSCEKASVLPAPIDHLTASRFKGRRAEEADGTCSSLFCGHVKADVIESVTPLSTDPARYRTDPARCSFTCLPSTDPISRLNDMRTHYIDSMIRQSEKCEGEREGTAMVERGGHVESRRRASYVQVASKPRREGRQRPAAASSEAKQD